MFPSSSSSQQQSTNCVSRKELQSVVVSDPFNLNGMHNVFSNETYYSFSNVQLGTEMLKVGMTRVTNTRTEELTA